ncbi:MAG: MurR/RpiR family transcriptional regulator [Deltaproteobacteria bacterium]|nr:MurR/RpiR family transcriptional regulator [Deltaproteobacteria bacterium]
MHNERTPLTERLAMHGDMFTASDAVIADYLLSNYPKSLLQNASEVAEALEFNNATVTRFFMKLGYASAKEAMADFKAELEFIIDAPINRYGERPLSPDGHGAEIAELLQIEQENIATTLTGLDVAAMKEVARLFGEKDRKVFIVGTRKEYSIAYYLYIQLLTLRENVSILREHSISNFISGIDESSVCVVMDFRRYAKLNRQIATYAKNLGAKLVAISDSRFCGTALIADHQFTVASKSTTMFDSYTAAASLINALMLYTIAQNGEVFKERLTKIESIYKEFDVFSSMK